MYTVEQIRNAGTEGEISLIDVEHLIDVLNRLYSSDVSQNSGKPLVMRSFTACPSCGSDKIYFEGWWTCRQCTHDWGGK